MVNITRGFMPSDRYRFDTGACSSAKGYSQVDSKQDASYYGHWASPSERTIVAYCEGDVTRTVCDTDAEFVEQMRELAAWVNDSGYGPLRVDPGSRQELIAEWEALGLADLFYPAYVNPND